MRCYICQTILLHVAGPALDSVGLELDGEIEGKRIIPTEVTCPKCHLDFKVYFKPEFKVLQMPQHRA